MACLAVHVLAVSHFTRICESHRNVDGFAAHYRNTVKPRFNKGLFTSHLVNVKTFAKAKSSWSNTTSLLLSGCYDEHDERMN